MSNSFFIKKNCIHNSACEIQFFSFKQHVKKIDFSLPNKKGRTNSLKYQVTKLVSI